MSDHLQTGDWVSVREGRCEKETTEKKIDL